MAAQERAGNTIWRRKRVQEETGISRSGIYLAISQRLFPKPVRLGSRAVGWLAAEIDAMNAARVSGRSDAEIRELVAKLEGARHTAMDRV